MLCHGPLESLEFLENIPKKVQHPMCLFVSHLRVKGLGEKLQPSLESFSVPGTFQAYASRANKPRAAQDNADI